MNTHEFLRNTVIYLLSVVIAVPVFKRLGLGSVLGYLVAGVLIGPSVLGLIHSPEQILHFAEFGVVLLLFLIGLELEPQRLWQIRKPVLGMGGLQVVFSVTALTLVGFLVTGRATLSLVAAMGLAMSSTALVIQLLRERNLLMIPVGQAAFAILLFQDLAVIPMLAVLPLLSHPDAGAGAQPASAWIPVLKGLAAIVSIIVIGRFLVRPLFRIVAQTGLREVFTAFSLVLILGIAWIMQEVGLSMALGAFLGGVLLANSEYRHELEIDIEPFKGLLLGLFFIAVGMGMDVGLILRAPLLVASLVVTVLAIKGAVLYALGRIFGHSQDESILLGISLPQGGEFAFVLFGLALQLKIFGAEEAAILNITVALSMAATPLLFVIHERVIALRLKKGATARKYDVQDEGSSVILAGFGRIGQVVGRLLHAQKIPITILEQDPGQIEVVRRFGWKTFYGDVSRLDLLHAAGAERAKLLILAIDDMDATLRTIKLVRERFPKLKIMVRADSRLDAYAFLNEGVPTVRATFAPGLEMGEEALKILGYGAHEARTIAKRFRHYDFIQLKKSAKHMHDMPTLISLSHESRDELARIMDNDDRRQTEIVGDGWG